MDLFRQQQENGGCISNCWEPRQTLWERPVHRLMTDENDLAKEMNELSFQEREMVFEEIHGVAQAQEETPEFINKALVELDRALAQLFKHKRKALDRAFFLKPTIQTDTKFKLLFLRCDYFNASKAANRMARHFERKLVLFGEEKLVKNITMDDLTEAEIDNGRKTLGLLPMRDRSGRSMHVSYPNKFDFESLPVDSMIRGAWYQIMALLDDDEAASKKGLCSVVYSPKSNEPFKSESIARIAQVYLKAGDAITNDLPIRYTSYHYCTNASAMTTFLSAIQPGLGKQIRLRLRTHFGSPVEIKYSLLTFGLDCGNIIDCYDENAGWPVEVLCKAFAKRRKETETRQEQERLDDETASGVIAYPNPNDVLIGRGHPFMSYCGNKRYHQMVECHLERYKESNNRYLRATITRDIVKQIKESNGRFLSQTKGGWTVIDDSLAREKTAVAFRSKSNKRSKG